MRIIVVLCINFLPYYALNLEIYINDSLTKIREMFNYRVTSVFLIFWI